MIRVCQTLDSSEANAQNLLHHIIHLPVLHYRTCTLKYMKHIVLMFAPLFSDISSHNMSDQLSIYNIAFHGFTTFNATRTVSIPQSRTFTYLACDILLGFGIVERGHTTVGG